MPSHANGGLFSVQPQNVDGKNIYYETNEERGWPWLKSALKMTNNEILIRIAKKTS